MQATAVTFGVFVVLIGCVGLGLAIYFGIVRPLLMVGRF